LGRYRGISQLFFDATFAFGYGNASGRISRQYIDSIPLDTVDGNPIFEEQLREILYHEIDGLISGHYSFAISKRFYAKRFALTLRTGVGFQHEVYLLKSLDLEDYKYGYEYNDKLKPIDLINLDTSMDYSLKSSQWGGYSEANLEIAITPGFSIGGGFGYRYFGSGFDLEYKSRPNDDSETDYEKPEKVMTFTDAPDLSYNGMYWSGYFNIRPTFGKKRKKN
jgi:hypothetical protein